MAACVIEIFDGRSLWSGEFRLDDFGLIWAVKNQARTEMLLSPANGHFMPLFRLQFSTLLQIFGPEPAAFNILDAVSCFALLGSGCWLLAELGARQATLVFFLVFSWVWIGWAQVTAGYYVLLTYPQCAALGFMAIAALYRFSASRKARWLVVSLLATEGAALVDSAGLWAFAATGIFSLIAFFSRGKRLPAAYLVLLLLAAFLTVGGIAVMRAAPTIDLREAGDPSRVIIQIWSGLVGLVICSVTPFVPGSWLFNVQFDLLQFAATFVFAAASLYWFLRRSKEERLILAGLGAVILLQVYMVVLARPAIEPGAYWPAKWVMMAHSWFSLALAYAIDRTCPAQVGSSGKWLRFLASLLGITCAMYLIGNCYLDAKGASRGRSSYCALARRRSTDLARLHADVVAASNRLGVSPIVLPPAGNRRFFRIFPGLEFWDLDHFLVADKSNLASSRADVKMTANLARALSAVPDFAAIYSLDGEQTSDRTPTAGASR